MNEADQQMEIGAKGPPANRRRFSAPSQHPCPTPVYELGVDPGVYAELGRRRWRSVAQAVIYAQAGVDSGSPG